MYLKFLMVTLGRGRTCRIDVYIGHKFCHRMVATRTKRADLQQICNRSVLAKTDYLQTNLISSAESVFSLLQTVSLNTLRNSETADEKQTNNRSADYLQHLQMICNTVKSKNWVDRPFIVS